jgi:hypothetical protein
MAVLELTTFRLAAGVDDGTFLAADELARTGFLYQQPGLVRATTARGENGGWLVLLLWDADGDATAAARRADADPAAAAFLALVDRGSLERRRYTTLD